MRAILVGKVEEDNLYYDIDASEDEKDAILVRPDGSMVEVDLFDFANSCGGLLKIRTSRFHKFLWGGASKRGWNEVFMDKTKPVNEQMIEGLDIYQSLGKNKKKLDIVNKKVSGFKKTINKKEKKKGKVENIKTKSAQPCCDDEMVKFDISDLAFKKCTSQKRSMDSNDFASPTRGINK